MVGSFDDHFVRADAIHAIEQAFAFAVKAAFNAESGKFIRHHAERPARRIFSAAVAAVGENFGRRFRFISRAERDNSRLPLISTLSRTKSSGRLPRSVEIMTQRPVIGSLRSSGKLPSSANHLDSCKPRGRIIRRNPANSTTRCEVRMQLRQLPCHSCGWARVFMQSPELLFSRCAGTDAVEQEFPFAYITRERRGALELGRASPKRPSLASRSPRTLGRRW